MSNQKRDRKGKFAEMGRTSSVSDLPSDVPEHTEDEVNRLDITPEELNEMLTPQQPATVRLAAVQTPYPQVAEKASHDPDPVIRAVASHGFDLSEGARDRLAGDVEVQRVLTAMRA